MSGGLTLPPKLQPFCSYKDICHRFCSIFGFNGHNHDSQECARCGSYLCSTACIQDREEIIIFDFGSKTTWLKYASETTGQLSMHPTVAPVHVDSVSGLGVGINSGAAAWCDATQQVSLIPPSSPREQNSPDNQKLVQCCPVCTKNFVTRVNRIRNKACGSRTDISGAQTSTTSSRFATAFAKLSLKKMHCFDSSNLTDDDMDMVLDDPTHVSVQAGIAMVLPEGAEQMLPVLQDVLRKDDKSKGAHASAELCSDNSASGNSCTTVDGGSARKVTNCHDRTVQGDTEKYKFLTRHMLKRNPFFHVKSIPFVICEPAHCNQDMKTQLLEFLFACLKVPG